MTATQLRTILTDAVGRAVVLTYLGACKDPKERERIVESLIKDAIRNEWIEEEE